MNLRDISGLLLLNCGRSHSYLIDFTACALTATTRLLLGRSIGSLHPPLVCSNLCYWVGQPLVDSVDQSPDLCLAVSSLDYLLTLRLSAHRCFGDFRVSVSKSWSEFGGKSLLGVELRSFCVLVVARLLHLHKLTFLSVSLFPEHISLTTDTSLCVCLCLLPLPPSVIASAKDTVLQVEALPRGSTRSRGNLGFGLVLAFA